MNFNLKNYDILSVNPQLYVESEKRQKTEFGGFTSVILVMILMASMVYFFLEVFLRNSFLVIYNQITDSRPVLNFTNLPIGLALFDSQAKLVDMEGQVRIFAEFHEISADKNREVLHKIIKIKLERCNISNHLGEYKDYFKKNPLLEKYWCIPKGKYNLTLHGNWADSVNSNSYLLLKISKCFNTEDTYLFPTQICKNMTLIDSNLLQVFLNIFYLDNDIDHNNYENPGQLISKSETFALSSTSYSSYYIKKKIVKYQTDSGFLFSNLRNENFFQEDTLSMITDLSVNKSPTGLFGNINISLSKKTDIFFRGYIKLQSALANIGGIVEGIFFFFSAIMKLLMKRYYYTELGKSAYKFSADPIDKIQYFQPFKFKNYKIFKNEKRIRESKLNQNYPNYHLQKNNTK